MLHNVLTFLLVVFIFFFILYAMNRGKKAYLLTDNRETALEILVMLLIFNSFFYDHVVGNVHLITYVALAEYVKAITLNIAAFLTIFSLALFIQIFLKPKISIRS